MDYINQFLVGFDPLGLRTGKRAARVPSDCCVSGSVALSH